MLLWLGCCLVTADQWPNADTLRGRPSWLRGSSLSVHCRQRRIPRTESAPTSSSIEYELTYSRVAGDRDPGPHPYCSASCERQHRDLALPDDHESGPTGTFRHALMNETAALSPGRSLPQTFKPSAAQSRAQQLTAGDFAEVIAAYPGRRRLRERAYRALSPAARSAARSEDRDNSDKQDKDGDDD